MPVNWLQIGYIVAINTALGAIVTLIFLKLGLPKLLSKAEIWMGGAIGRFMQNLAKQAAEEEEAGGGTGHGGQLKFMGFTINEENIKIIGKIIETAQSFGFLKGGGKGGAGESPFKV